MAIRLVPVLVISGDTTPPVVTLSAGPTKSKISRVAGQDSTNITWSSNEDFTTYEIRVVPSGTSLVTEGQLLEQDQTPPSGGTANTSYTSTITDAELEAAAGVEGNNIVKVFVRDAAGNWST